MKMMKVLMSHDRWKQFPNCPKEFPMALLNEDHAKGIHGQTLAQLNERGGLSPVEIIVNIKHLNFRAFDTLEYGECVDEILNHTTK